MVKEKEVLDKVIKELLGLKSNYIICVRRIEILNFYIIRNNMVQHDALCTTRNIRHRARR